MSIATSPPRLRRSRASVVLAGLGALAVLLAGVLPWRADRITGGETLVELIADAPGLAVAYGCAAAAALAATVLIMRGALPRRLVVVLAGLAVLAALLALVGTPLPSGYALGAGADGRMFEVEVPSYRTWGCYLAVVGAALTLAAGAFFARRPRSLTP